MMDIPKQLVPENFGLTLSVLAVLVNRLGGEVVIEQKDLDEVARMILMEGIDEPTMGFALKLVSRYSAQHVYDVPLNPSRKPK